MNKKVIVVLFSAFLILAACGTESSTNTEVTNSNDGSGSEKVEENKTSSGVFNGKVDPQTIEIEIDGSYKSFFVPKEIYDSTLPNLEEGSQVYIEYFSNNDNRLEITKLVQKD